jgi:hypothetical protein
MATQTRVNSRSSFPLSKIFCGVIIVSLIAFGGFYFYKYQNLNNKYQELTQSVDDKKAKYIAEVSKLYEIPAKDKEDPTFAIVSDQTNLDELKKISKFYENTKTGDVILLYKEANIAILYRPSDKKIINTDSYLVATTNPNVKAEIAIIAPVALQADIEKKISDKFKNIEITNKSEPKTAITKGIVVDVNGNETDASKQLAELLGYSVDKLPAGEVAPEGAKLVIVAPKVAQ